MGSVYSFLKNYIQNKKDYEDTVYYTGNPEDSIYSQNKYYQSTKKKNILNIKCLTDLDYTLEKTTNFLRVSKTQTKLIFLICLTAPYFL